MSLNDKNIGGAHGVDVYPGVSNPITSSVPGDPMATNFVEDPTSQEAGAGAGPDFAGDRDAKKAMKPAAGVVEARPGIIEDTHIDPLSETSNKDDGWANAIGVQGQSKSSEAAHKTTSTAENVVSAAAGAAKVAYGKVTGSDAYVEEGRQAIHSNA